MSRISIILIQIVANTRQAIIKRKQQLIDSKRFKCEMMESPKESEEKEEEQNQKEIADLPILSRQSEFNRSKKVFEIFEN